LPVIYTMGASNHMARLSIPDANQVFALPERAIVNPGSVGQPRDRDPRAAFAVFDTEAKMLDYRRVPYNFTEVQRRMTSVGLPNRHIQRLAAGW
jgi:diadenosine tetraphosphatase ApaH/serine/threonine PP2A family protein phosphatase